MCRVTWCIIRIALFCTDSSWLDCFLDKLCPQTTEQYSSIVYCMFICLFARISPEHVIDLHQFFCWLRRRRGSVLWQRCNMLRTSGFMDDVIFPMMGCIVGMPLALQRSLQRRLQLMHPLLDNWLRPLLDDIWCKDQTRCRGEV